MCESTSRSSDIAIIGGGIAGLYFAWRLRDNDRLTVTLFECSETFGGRVETQTVPGGFCADMGAMRYLPNSHKIIQHLVKTLNLPTEACFSDEDKSKNTAKHFFQTRHISDEKLYELNATSNHLKDSHIARHDFIHLVDIPADRNWPAMKMKDGSRAKDITIAGVLASAHDANLLATTSPHYPTSLVLADKLAWNAQFERCQYVTLKNGMNSLVTALASETEKNHRNSLLTGHKVVMITEDKSGRFILTVDHKGLEKTYTVNKLVLACNARGVELISWNSPYKRSSLLQEMFAKVVRATPVKIYLTYRNAWWEKCGLHAGTIQSDLPIGQIIAFGERAKKGGYATLLTCLTLKYTDVFEGLNVHTAERFSPLVGEVPTNLQPSQKLVAFIQQQLKLVFNVSQIPEAVYALCRIWSADPIAAGISHYRVGTDSNEIQWSSLKPFPDCEIYMTGDTFPVTCKTGSLTGWMESSVLTSERILVKYFGLNPITQDLPLQNEWPGKEPSI